MNVSTLRALALGLCVAHVGHAQYRPADLGQKPGNTTLLPEQLLRGFDPITVYFSSDQVDEKANADDGPKRLKLTPTWPGAYSWVDRRTLQFRPAEPWPPLARFAVEGGGQRRVLTTMMSAPSAMAPSNGSEGLRPFRVITLTFPQQLPAGALKKMLKLELRDLPGLGDSPARALTSWSLAPLPRTDHRSPASWTLTLEDDVPEGKRLIITASLALGSEGSTLWRGQLSTRPPFALTEVRCGSASFAVLGGASTPKDLALTCGNRGETPQLAFTAPVQGLTLTQLRQLVRFEPSVPDLHFTIFGSRVQLLGKFVPDTLYNMSLGNAAITDDAQRPLREVKAADVYFHLGWRAPFLAWQNGTALLEAKGPRTVAMRGYGEARADVRVYRIDALHTGLWPWPSTPLVVDEQSDPPFPGEEPELTPPGTLDSRTLNSHLRLLGSPLISRVVELPLSDKAGATTFGFDLRALLDPVVGANRPGTYLVGLRRLTGRPERSYMRVQITNLSFTVIEETGKAIGYVRTLDTGEPVRGAVITLEGTRPVDGGSTVTSERLTTDAEGKVVLSPRAWTSVTRASIAAGDDVLVLSPREELPAFARNHWSGGDWLSWLTSTAVPPPINDATLGFIFPERGIYRPGDKVFLKAFVRRKERGELRVPADLTGYGINVEGPDGTVHPLELKRSQLGGLEATFDKADLPTGEFTAVLYDKAPETVLARRTFRIEAYRLPTFEVLLNGASRVRNDTSFKVKATARYYAGGNVGNQPIRWRVTREAYFWSPSGHPGFLFSSSSRFSRAQSNGGSPVTSHEDTLDDDGAAELVTNPQLDLDGSPRLYRFEATVTGADEQPVTSAMEVKALPAFALGLKVPRYLEKATALTPEIVAVGVDDKLLAGQQVRVRLFRRVWHSTLRETSFATGKAAYQTEQEDLPLGEQTLTTTAGALKPTFPITESGVYVVELFARDKLGRVQTLSADLYIGGQTPQNWQKSREGVFELKADRASYAPGDTAHLIVQSPYVTAQALVVIEEPQGNRYLWKDISGSKAVIDVPITERFVPNVPVHVVVMRGRLGEGKADDSRYKPATVASSIDLEVTPAKNQVRVSVKHPELARPGTTHDFVISLTDDQKRPIGGEVTLWLVDEAVLSLAKEGSLDPLSELIRRNRRSVSIFDTRNLVVGQVTELEEEPGGDGSDDEGQAGARLVRKSFKTVPYYAATLVVPASGTLTVPITLSDDLTTFKVRAVAASGSGRFGFVQDSLKVRLPVLVQPQLPRFVRLGDRFWPGAVARVVEGAEGPGSVSISLKGPVEGKATSQSKIGLSLKKAQSVLTPVTVKSSLEEPSLTVRVDVTRLSDKAGDAFEVKLPVLPDRAVEKRARFLTFEPGSRTLPAFPEAPRPGTASQVATFTTERGILELVSGLDYLRDYPHGCLEQRMSQVTPGLSLRGLLRRLELETGQPSTVYQGAVKRIIEELKLHQDENGLMAFWPGSKGTVQLTGQGVEFLFAARKAGYAIDEPVLRKALDALKRSLRTDAPTTSAEYRFNDQTSALRALAVANELDDNYLVELYAKRSAMDPSSLAQLTLAMSARPNTFASNLPVLSKDLWERAQFKLVNGKKVFEGIRGDRTAWSGGYLGSGTATTATVWDALLRVAPTDERHPAMRDALLQSNDAARGFGSTWNNRLALTALGTYLDRALTPGQKVSVAFERNTPELVLEAYRKAGRREVRDGSEVRFTVTGGEVSARVDQTFLPLTLGSSVSANAEGLIVTRSLDWIHSDGSATTHHADSPNTTLHLPQGEIVEINAQLTLDAAQHHVALVVPFAAGLELLNPALETSGADATPSQSDSTTPTYVQRLDSEVRYYFTSLPRGTHSFHFRARATNEGRFVHPPAWAELMYRDTVRGRGAGMSVVVTGEHEK